MLDSISLKSIIDLGDSKTRLCSTKFGKSSEKRGGGKEAVAAQAPASVTSMKAKRQRSDRGRHCVLSASHSSLIHCGWHSDSP